MDNDVLAKLIFKYLCALIMRHMRHSEYLEHDTHHWAPVTLASQLDNTPLSSKWEGESRILTKIGIELNYDAYNNV